MKEKQKADYNKEESEGKKREKGKRRKNKAEKGGKEIKKTIVKRRQ